MSRGIRNNNPGNIRIGEPWRGLSAEQTDHAFAQFEHATYGIRALCKILITYQDRHGLKTVSKMINRYAPPSENDTGEYSRHIAAELGVTEREAVDVHDPVIMRGMLAGIILHENGSQPYGYEIDDGMTLAGIV